MFGTLAAALTSALGAFARRGSHAHPGHHRGAGHHASGPHKAGAKPTHVHQARRALAKVPPAKTAPKHPAGATSTRKLHTGKAGTKQTPTTKGNVTTGAKKTAAPAPSGLGKPGYNRAQPRNQDGMWN